MGRQSLCQSSFTGKEHDPESGNDYFGARYYASSMGRFMSPDWSAQEEPVPYAKLDNPQTLNLYAYVGNNPISGVDPDGHLASEGMKGNDWLSQANLRLAAEMTTVSMFFSLPPAQQQSGDKKQQSLGYKVLKTGKDEQQIRWQLSQKSKSGGIIVQEVNMFDPQGNLVHDYYEAWTVNKGGKGPGDSGDYDYDDRFQAPMSGGKVQGSAIFYEGATMPDNFVRGAIPQAGTLPSAKGPPDPALSTAGATAPVTRVFIQP